MIWVRLMGGLGNQMFQYAAGRALALGLGVPLRLDTNSYQKSCARTTPRRYELDVFMIEAEVASASEMKQLTGPLSKVASLLDRLGHRLLKRAENPITIYREPHFHYDSGIRKLSDNSCLIGYWQSDRYFVDYAEQLLMEFRCRQPLDTANQAVADTIQQAESVAVHIRRGDYVHNKKTKASHGLCSLAYYQQAAAFMAQKLTSPHFFVFSDDPDWVMSSLQLGYPFTPVLCNHNGSAVNDLRLISLCRHAIIANSSFSWWGGWLIRNPDKLIIAPKLWFADSQLNTQDLLPTGWISL